MSWRAQAALVPILVLAMAVAGCGGSDGDGSEDDTLTGVVWKWQEFDAEEGEDIEVSDPSRYTIEFTSDAGEFQLKADCNSGSGQATIEGQNITIDMLAMTEAFCGDQSLDQDFARLLGEAETFDRDGADLTFNLANDGGEMEFKAQ